jgi:hypothetical protein
MLLISMGPLDTCHARPALLPNCPCPVAQAAPCRTAPQVRIGVVAHTLLQVSLRSKRDLLMHSITGGQGGALAGLSDDDESLA